MRALTQTGLAMDIVMMRQIMLDVCLMVEIAVERILILYFAMNAYAMNKQNMYMLLNHLMVRLDVYLCYE